MAHQQSYYYPPPPPPPPALILPFGSQYPAQPIPVPAAPQYAPIVLPVTNIIVGSPNYVPHPSAPPVTDTNIPMPQYAYPAPSIPLPNPIPIIAPQFCTPYPLDLAITRKVLTITDGNFVVTHLNGIFMFKVKGRLFSLHDRRVILDASGKPIVNLRQKILTAHNRWEVFRGESSDPRDLIFTAKTSSMIQLKTKLDVFLAHNTSQLVCDYKVKGSWSERSCIVYAGESSSIVAKVINTMHKKMSVQSVLFGKDKFMVTVYPNIDFAFIVALIVILDDTNTDD